MSDPSSQPRPLVRTEMPISAPPAALGSSTPPAAIPGPGASIADETIAAIALRAANAALARSSEFTRKDFIISVIMPLLLLVLTAVSVNFIGGHLQEQAFRRSELFKARLQRISNAQDEARRLRHEAEDAYRTLRSREDYARSQIAGTQPESRGIVQNDFYRQMIASPSLQVLRRTAIDANILVEDVGGGGMSDAGRIGAAYSAEFQVFRDCIHANRAFEKSCADEHDELIGHLQQLVLALGKRADALIHEQSPE